MIPVIGKFTYSYITFISNVISLIFSLVCNFCNSTAISCEFSVLYTYGKLSRSRSFLLIKRDARFMNRKIWLTLGLNLFENYVIIVVVTFTI